MKKLILIIVAFIFIGASCTTTAPSATQQNDSNHVVEKTNNLSPQKNAEEKVEETKEAIKNVENLTNSADVTKQIKEVQEEPEQTQSAPQTTQAAPTVNRTVPAQEVKQCCKYCSKGKACGDSCISKSYTCHKGPGCACNSY